MAQKRGEEELKRFQKKSKRESKKHIGAQLSRLGRRGTNRTPVSG